MKTVKQLADELQVTPQGVYKKIKQLDTKLNNCLSKGLKGETLINELGEQIIKESFKLNVDVNKTKQQDNNLKYVKYLETRIEALEQELADERNHNKELDVKLFEIVATMNEITKANQVLMLAAATKEKKGFFNKIISVFIK